MHAIEQTKRRAAELHWLAFLLTGRREISVDLAVDLAGPNDDPNPYFWNWLTAWSRRNAIAKALTIIREELAASARRTKSRRISRGALLAPGWTLGENTGKTELERALLAIDVFPRAALVLLVFEGVPLRDAAILLDAEPDLIRKAQAIALRELTANLARIQGWKSTRPRRCVLYGEVQHA
jgi:hypothetical protein